MSGIPALDTIRAPFPYQFAWNRLGRKGQLCRVFARSRRGGIYGKGMNSVGLEFEDGFKMVTSGNSIRKVAR